jgi:hypothetical protein
MVTALAPRCEIGHKVPMKSRFFAILALVPVTALCVTACSVPVVPEPARTPAPKPVMQPPAVKPSAAPSGQWIDWPITPGDWVYRTDDRGSIALFGPAGRDAIVTLRCDRSRGALYFSRADEAGTRGGSMTIRTSSALKQFPAGPVGSAPAYVAAEIAPNDSFLDAMIFTRGRFAVEAPGQQSIAVPSWSEVAKVIEDCRG